VHPYFLHSIALQSACSVFPLVQRVRLARVQQVIARVSNSIELLARLSFVEAVQVAIPKSLLLTQYLTYRAAISRCIVSTHRLLVRLPVLVLQLRLEHLVQIRPIPLLRQLSLSRPLRATAIALLALDFGNFARKVQARTLVVLLLRRAELLSRSKHLLSRSLWLRYER